jgi:tetratricopeptide (TPR) repeat protein
MPGRDDQADERRRQLLRARALYEKSREPQRTFFLASVDEVLAAVLFYEGRAEEALAVYRRVEAARAELLGPEHLAVAIALANQADCSSMLGRFDEALALLRRALAAVETPGADHAYLRARLADVLRRRGAPARALDEDRRARAAAEQHGSSVYLDAALTGEGLDLIALGRAAEAVSPLERAVAARERGAAAPSDLAEVRFALARALAASGGDRARAKKLAELARADFRPLAERHGSFYRASLADIERFLTELDARP